MENQYPKQIFDEFLKNNLDFESTIDKFMMLLENGEKVKLRQESLNYFIRTLKYVENNVNFRDKIFNFLENLLISDVNPKIRKKVVKVLPIYFPEKSYNILKYSLLTEQDDIVLDSVYWSLINLLAILAKDKKLFSDFKLKKEISEICKKELKFNFEITKELKKSSNANRNELFQFLLNFFTLIFLKKKYWRLKYEIRDWKIIELEIMFKGLKKIPNCISYLQDIKKLSLRYNQIQTIPSWISKLSKLEVLNLNSNELKKIHNSIGKLNSLKVMLLWNNQLKYLPETIINIQSLKELNLRLNKLIALPWNIGNLRNLTRLDLHDNKLTSIPESISKLKLLINLDLSWNSLEKLPPSIGELNSLVSLNLEMNELKEIPSSIGELNSLEILNLKSNKLISIPDSIGRLKSLKYLNLSRNSLKKLPNSLLNNSSLIELYISQNEIDMNSDYLEKLREKGVNIYI